jgi:protein-tyrosine-phosphatase
MENVHARTIESSWPEAAGKVELFGKSISGDWTEDDVIDPYGKSPYHYRVAQSQISLGVQNLARRIVEDAQNKGYRR